MSDDAHTSVAELRAMMREFVAQRQWEKFHTPRNLAASVAIEAGELLEHFQWLTPEEVEARRGDPAFKHAVGEELSDVLMYLLSLANAMEIDIASAAQAKMQRNCQKYPAEKFLGVYHRPARE